MLEQGRIVEGHTVGPQLSEGPLVATWLLHGSSGAIVGVLQLLQTRLVDFRQRFQQSTEVLCSLSHPNLVQIHEVVEIDGMDGLIAEHLSGGNLADWIASTERSPAEVVPMFYGIATGVGAAHAAGLLHRNLKPSKILISEGGQPKVSGFVLGKVTTPSSGSNTEIGTTFGTPEYMPPEQFRGVATVDERADLFALGCLLYEMLSGQRAFAGSDLMEMYQAVLAGSYAPLPAGIPAGLVGIVADLVDPDPDQRPQSVASLLERFLEDPELAALLERDPPTLDPGEISVPISDPILADPSLVEPVSLVADVVFDEEPQPPELPDPPTVELIEEPSRAEPITAEAVLVEPGLEEPEFVEPDLESLGVQGLSEEGVAPRSSLQHAEPTERFALLDEIPAAADFLEELPGSGGSPGVVPPDAAGVPPLPAHLQSADALDSATPIGALPTSRRAPPIEDPGLSVESESPLGPPPRLPPGPTLQPATEVVDQAPRMPTPAPLDPRALRAPMTASVQRRAGPPSLPPPRPSITATPGEQTPVGEERSPERIPVPVMTPMASGPRVASPVVAAAAPTPLAPAPTRSWAQVVVVFSVLGLVLLGMLAAAVVIVMRYA